MGVAAQHWGEPRTTHDVDLVVVVSPEEAQFLEAAVCRFHPRVSDAISFARRSRVLLIAASDGTPVDISLGLVGYEEEAVRRAVTVSLPGLGPIRIVSAEDLVIHKCLAARPRDIEDVERILVRQRLHVDMRYIRKWLVQFAPLVEDHDVAEAFETALRKAKSFLEPQE